MVFDNALISEQLSKVWGFGISNSIGDLSHPRQFLHLFSGVFFVDLSFLSDELSAKLGLNERRMN
ncbi:hypothetical protein V511_09780 [Mesotoga sp. Brook.08.YT.4.2.5.1]|nr:hypothetical protein V511_09780 [Mesotoga sp. Brook.08.YT.4.2.5.1]PVD17315.1 hypothetical protein V512_010370 [Mesotoga sp. Brook.08.105.5.1]RAO98254.1 hypothetical protein M388_00045 [Mesotoga sp. Brook.08.YT.4.2.5.4.]RDI92385.1 hypothetical protein Q502_08960 [Mesotoga sp. Brook.08.YT.4.2.5.2.]